MKRFVIALMVIATSAIGLARTTDPGTIHQNGFRASQLAKLDLTDAQKQQLKDIRTANQEQNKQLYADFQTKLQQFRALKTANDPGAADVKAQLKAMKPQLHAARKGSRDAMLNVLTPDQRAQLKAAGPGHRFARIAGRRLRGAAARQLNLTDAQQAQLKQLHQTGQQQNAQLFADLRAKRQELRALMQANDPGAGDLRAQLQALRPQVEAARKQQRTELLNVLTPEQRTQLEQWKAQRQSRGRLSR